MIRPSTLQDLPILSDALTHLLEGHVSLMVSTVGTSVKFPGDSHAREVAQHARVKADFPDVWVEPPPNYRFVGSNMKFTAFERDMPHPK